MAADKRQEILDQLKAAVASFRHCLELQPDNAHARRDIELVRQWIKYYTDQWHAHDREKRRQETNLVAFLEFLIETQRALRESVKALTATAPADAFAEPKRLQDELQEEIPPLKEKIKTELTPQQPGGWECSARRTRSELEQGITLLAGLGRAPPVTRCHPPRATSTSRQAGPAAADQQSAIDELEKIWDAVIPFHPLLARDLADQTTIAQSLAPASPPIRNQKLTSPPAKTIRIETKPSLHRKAPSAGTGHAALGTEREDLAPLTEIQERTLRRTQLLKLKAEAELARLEKSPPPDAAQKRHDPAGKDDPQDAGAPSRNPSIPS